MTNWGKVLISALLAGALCGGCSILLIKCAVPMLMVLLIVFLGPLLWGYLIGRSMSYWVIE